MTLRILTLLLFTTIVQRSTGQCGTTINSFPYNEDFEGTDGGWIPGGAGNDWEWGSPSKSTITGAGGGVNSWIVGGLTGSSYTNGEASWLQSPCFDFTGLPWPYIEFKVFWETEQQFDGAALQYSIDNGATWTTIGNANANDCVNKNWYNQGAVTYLSSLTANRQGWSGNRQSTAGNCRGGGGSSGWLTASHVLTGLGNKRTVQLRFIFGAGTICNNYDGFAIDDVYIGAAPPNNAGFEQNCINSRTIAFKNTSSLCPVVFNWDFGDPASGAANTAATPDATHIFSGPGTYTVSLTVSSPGMAPSTATKEVQIINANIDMLTMVDCQTNRGGSLILSVEGAVGIPLNLLWNTNPPQTTHIISNLPEGEYTVNISGAGVCPQQVTGKAEKDISCIGIYFPSGFTPNGDSKNDDFGALGSITSLTSYQLSIYNRWGERIFYTTDPYKKWDGMVGRVKTDGNMFVWYSEFRLRGRSAEKRKGVITLIR